MFLSDWAHMFNTSERRVPPLMASCSFQTYSYPQYFVSHFQSISDGVLMDWLYRITVESDFLVKVCQTQRFFCSKGFFCSKLYQQAVGMLKSHVCSHLLLSEYLLGAPVMKDAYWAEK